MKREESNDTRGCEERGCGSKNARGRAVGLCEKGRRRRLSGRAARGEWEMRARRGRSFYPSGAGGCANIRVASGARDGEKTCSKRLGARGPSGAARTRPERFADEARSGSGSRSAACERPRRSWRDARARRWNRHASARARRGEPVDTPASHQIQCVLTLAGR